MTPEPAVLVTDGEQRSSLAVVRSLGRAGFRPFVCSRRPTSLASASRHAHGCATVPSSSEDPDACADAVVDLIGRWDIDVLIPMTDASILTLLPRCRQMSGLSIPMPDFTTVQRVSDKADTSRTARNLDIPVPRQLCLTDPSSDRSDSVARLDFPLVVKTSRSVPSVSDGTVRFTVRHASDATELSRVLEEFPREAYPLLIQEHIVGSGLGIFLLRWEGEILAEFAHRRLREKPPSGGVSVLRESITPDRSLFEQSRRLLDYYDWKGVAMIEYRVEDGSERPYFMEVNGRFWGSLQLAIDAGVDFPALLVGAATGIVRGGSQVTDYEPGVRCRWFWGDVDHLLLTLRHPDRYLADGADHGRSGALLDFARGFGPDTRDEVCRIDDPKPFFVETLQWLGAALTEG